MSDLSRQDDLNAPRMLRNGLAEICRPPQTVPHQTDMTVLAMARRKLARRGRLVLLRRYVPYAAAAGVLIVVGLTMFQIRETSRQPMAGRVMSLQAFDVNEDSRLDILDAFALQRRVDARLTRVSLNDVNGDKVVDHADVKMLAMLSVSLGAETRP